MNRYDRFNPILPTKHYFQASAAFLLLSTLSHSLLVDSEFIQASDLTLKSQRMVILASAFMLTVCEAIYHLRFDIIFNVYPEYKNNRDFVRRAFTVNISNMRYASKQLLSDSKFVNELLNCETDISDHTDFSSLVYELNIYQFIVLKILAEKYIPTEALDSPSFILDIYKNNIKALEYASPRLKSSDNFILEALKIHGNALEYASIGLITTQNFILQAYFIDASALDFIPTAFCRERTFVLKALHLEVIVKQKGRKCYATILNKIDPDLKSDERFMLEAIKIHEYAYIYATSYLKAQLDFSLKAFEKNWKVIKLLPRRHIKKMPQRRDRVCLKLVDTYTSPYFASESKSSSGEVTFKKIDKSDKSLIFSGNLSAGSPAPLSFLCLRKIFENEESKILAAKKASIIKDIKNRGRI